MKYEGKYVQIMAMSECPNNCEHCFIHYKGHINFDELDTMMESYSKDYSIILNGTELLMNDKYLELCNKYHQNFIYTNGMLLTKEKMDVLKKNNINRISISLHYGIQEQISKVGLTDVSHKIKEAIANGFEVRVLCTVDKDNYKILPEIAEFVKSLGVKSLKFINMLKEGKAEDNIGDVFLNQEEINEFLDILYEVRKKYDKDDFYVTRNGAFGNDKRNKNNFHCPAGEDLVLLTPDHRVFPCNGLQYDEFCIGHWDDDGVYIDKEFKHDNNECYVLKRQLKMIENK